MKNKKSFIIFLSIIIVFIITIMVFLIIYKNKMIEDENLIKKWQENGMNLITYKTPSLFFVYIDLIQNYPISILMFLPPFLVIIPGLYNIFKIIKSGYIKYIVNFRKEYNIFIKKNIISCYKYAMIVPIIYLIMLIGCGIITNFNLELSISGLDSNMFSISFGSSIFLIIMTFANLFLADIFYINIGLITMLKVKNLFLNNIFSYLIIIMISIIFELFIGYSLAIITNNYIFANVTSLYNIWYPGDCGNILYVTGYILFLCLITTLIVFIVYKNEERIVSNV